MSATAASAADLQLKVGEYNCSRSFYENNKPRKSIKSLKKLELKNSNIEKKGQQVFLLKNLLFLEFDEGVSWCVTASS